MVAISLYKGNLHKVPDVPHRWPRPTPKISLKDFKILLRRRARALSRVGTSASDVAADVATTSNPNPAPASNFNPSCSNFDSSAARNLGSEVGGGNRVDNFCSDSGLTVKRELKKEEGVKEEGKAADEISVEGEGCLRKLLEKDDVLAMERATKDVETVRTDGVAEAQVNKAAEVIYFEVSCCFCKFLAYSLNLMWSEWMIVPCLGYRI